MNLSTYTDTLASLPPDLPVFFDNGHPAAKLISWRGDYAQLSLDIADRYNADADASTVAALLADAYDANYGDFQGYKGGTYTMRPSTTVWADPYGECDGWGIAGLSVEGNQVVITRVDLEDEVWGW